jgi:hypothetical protein
MASIIAVNLFHLRFCQYTVCVDYKYIQMLSAVYCYMQDAYSDTETDSCVCMHA